MTYFTFFYPTASATAYGQRPKFIRAEHSATAEGENWAYGPTLEYYSSVLSSLTNVTSLVGLGSDNYGVQKVQGLR